MTASKSTSKPLECKNSNEPPISNYKDVDRSKLTQMFQHYVDVKAAHPHAVLLYRVGDFFECYFDDAVTLAQELELVLTSKSVGDVGRIAMSGVPHHAWERHATLLVEKGYAVVICDQVQDAS